MLTEDYLSIWFTIPAADPLGRDEVMGKLRFLPEQVELYWRLKGNVFRQDDSEMVCIPLPYSEFESVELVKKWWSIRGIVLRLGNPTLVAAIPGAEMGKMVVIIDERSALDAKKLSSIIDFRRSIFLLDDTNRRLKWDQPEQTP
jgi:hypothetical protein